MITMRGFKSTTLVLTILLFVLGLSYSHSKSVGKGGPTLDLEDYLDTPTAKKEDLGTSATGYYGHHHQQPLYGHGHSHVGYPVVPPVYRQHGAVVGHHHHHQPYNYGHAQTYFVGEYGGLGLGHVGSAHVSYGTEINHGHSHHHQHSHGFYG